LLQNLYVPGEATQLIPAALCWMGALGAKAKRVHGGGFAGTVLALFGEDKLENAEKALAEHYGRENLQRVWIRPDGACEVLV
jgi:galactokinase